MCLAWPCTVSLSPGEGFLGTVLFHWRHPSSHGGGQSSMGKGLETFGRRELLKAETPSICTVSDGFGDVYCSPVASAGPGRPAHLVASTRGRSVASALPQTCSAVSLRDPCPILCFSLVPAPSFIQRVFITCLWSARLNSASGKLHKTVLVRRSPSEPGWGANRRHANEVTLESKCPEETKWAGCRTGGTVGGSREPAGWQGAPW